MSTGHNSTPPKRSRERGVALVLVLWVLALLTVLMVGFAGGARTELQLARNQWQSAQARAIADYGVAAVLLNLLDSAPETRWHADGQPHSLSYDGGTVQVSVTDEAGKIDLNAAPDELLLGLFRTLGLDEAEAGQLVGAIAQWKRLRHAESGDDDRNVPSRPLRGDGPFLAVEELRGVAGVTPAVYDLVSPFLTVYSYRPQIDPLTAPIEVLRSLPGAKPAEVDAFVAARTRLGPVPGALPALNGVGDLVGHTALRTVTITAAAKTDGGTRFTRSAVVALVGRPEAPYLFLAWRRVRRSDPEAPGSP